MKTANPTGEDSYKVGEKITYSFAVTNTGNVPLTDVTVTDTGFSGTGTLSAIDCPAAALAAGVAETCTATYVVAQAVVNVGHITNTATSTGTPPVGAGDPPTSTPSTVTIPSIPHPQTHPLREAEQP